MGVTDAALRSPVHAGELLARATSRLQAAGSPSARLDAELLVAHAFGRDRAWLLAHPETILEPGAASLLDGWLERRAGGEPVAYIRGFKEWRGLRLRTDRRALIPRPETELLADLAIAELAARLARADGAVSGWEVATGSGAVAVSLALRFRAALALGRVRLTASDISPDAIELASENLAAHGVAELVTLACGDLLDGAGARLPLADVVVANLPYLATEEVRHGGGSLRHEPSLALDGGADGLAVIRRLMAQLPGRLAPGGVALLEVGAGQAGSVGALAASLPVPLTVTVERDLAGIERVVILRAEPGADGHAEGRSEL